MTTCYNSRAADQYAQEQGEAADYAQALACYEADILWNLPAWLSDMIIDRLADLPEYRENLEADYQNKIDMNREPY